MSEFDNPQDQAKKFRAMPVRVPDEQSPFLKTSAQATSPRSTLMDGVTSAMPGDTLYSAPVKGNYGDKHLNVANLNIQDVRNGTALKTQGTDVRGLVPRTTTDMIYSPNVSQEVVGGSLPTKSMKANAVENPDTAIPVASGPRYKRVNDTNAPAGFAGTSRIATRKGGLVDLSTQAGTMKGAVATPYGVNSPMQAPNGVYGFNNQDLVDLYGGPAKSAMTDDQWRAQIDQNSAMPAGWVWDQAKGEAIPMNPSVKNAWQTADGKPIMVRGADGKPRPMVQEGTDEDLSFGAANRTSMPALDTSSPLALLSSALPLAYQSGQNRLKLQQRARDYQLLRDKYLLDLKKNDMGINARNAEVNAAKAQAEIGKLNAETAAVPGRGTAAGNKVSLDQAKHMTELYQMSPDAFDAIAGIHDQPEEERIKLRPQKLREMLGYGGTIQSASAAPASASASAPPVQGARQSPKDGKWYVADPNRPGKYLMVNQ